MNTNIIIPQKNNNNYTIRGSTGTTHRTQKQLKVVTDEKDKVARPLLDAISAERARFAPIIAKYEDAIKKYQTYFSIPNRTTPATKRKKRKDPF